MGKSDRPPKPASVAESKVMGRAAVIWVVAALQPVSIAQVAGLSGASGSVQATGPTDFATLWCTTAILAGAFMVASVAVRDPETKRVWEIAVNVLVVLASLIYCWSGFQANGHSFDGIGWALSISAALAGSCAGRAWLLVRQIWWVTHGGADA